LDVSVLDHERKPNPSLWGGLLWVPLVGLISGLAAAGLLNATAAILICLLGAPVLVGAASLVLRRRIRRMQGL
jgi:uncharacterized membrane-anchored protein